MRNDLPETCFSTLRSTGELIILKNGETGYHLSEWDTGDKVRNQEIAASHNSGCGINPAQVQAMEVGAMCGFEVPGANPQIYFDTAKHIQGLNIHGFIKDSAGSEAHPVSGKLHQYEVAGSKCFYLDIAAMPENLMGKQSPSIILPDLVRGKPLVPVTAQWTENGICTMTLETGAFTPGKEINADYAIIAKVGVGPVEYVLGELDHKIPFFVTWERTPANDRDGQPNYYWGHYFNNRGGAIKDFSDRTKEKFKALSEYRKPSIKKQLAVKPVPGNRPAAKQKDREVR